MNTQDSSADLCTDIRPDLDAYLDGELSSARREAVQTHLTDCLECQKQWEELRQLDAQLSPLRGESQRKGEELAARFESDSAHSFDSAGAFASRPKPAPIHAWWRWCVVAAAGALMFVILRPPNPTPGPAPVAQLVAATGPVEIQLESGGWLLVPAGSTQPVALQPGQRLRTSSAACELETSCARSVRINTESEIVIRQADQVELVRGQMWVRSSDHCEFTVALAEERLPLAAPRLFTCPSNSEIQWMAQDDKVVCASTCPDPVSVQSEQWVCTVRPGESFELTEQTPTAMRAAVPETKSWQIPLLHLRGAAVESELHDLIVGVLEKIGMTKASYFHESQIKALGPRGADPLLAFVLGSTSKSRPEIRIRAARIGCEMADETLIPLLRQLAMDENEDVRQYALKSLQRLGAT